jgi:hypothetical protein
MADLPLAKAQAAQLKAFGSRDKRNWSAFLARSGYWQALSNESA